MTPFSLLFHITSDNGRVTHLLSLGYNSSKSSLSQTDIFTTSGSKDHKEASPWKPARALSPSEHVTYVLFQEKNLSVVSSSLWMSCPF